jgi:hypothetical protein
MSDKKNNDNAKDDALEFIPLRPQAFDLQKSKSRLAEVTCDATLEYRCLVVVAIHLERYPPEAIGILNEDAWSSVIKLKYHRTAPDKGKRLTPAITERFLSSVEEHNPHLADSAVADKLLWKDIVELKFPSNGLARPRGLFYPWPVLVMRVEKAANDLLEVYNSPDSTNKDKQTLERAIQVLFDTPMSLSLLQETEAGKLVKKFIKLSHKNSKANELCLFTPRPIVSISKSNGRPMSPLQQLQSLIQSWKDIASQSGVMIQDTIAAVSANQRSSSISKKDKNNNDDHHHHHVPSRPHDLDEQLQVAETCQTWRQLFHILQERETQRRVHQGARMRESRERIAQNQPKIVKVRPAKAKHDAILNRPMGSKLGKYSSSSTIATITPAKSKLQLLREESKKAAAMQKSAPTFNKNSFGNAVAFASVGKSAKKISTPGSGLCINNNNGKRMMPPTTIPISALKKKLSKSFRK